MEFSAEQSEKYTFYHLSRVAYSVTENAWGPENVDLVGLKLNLYSQGIPYGLELSDIQRIDIGIVTNASTCPSTPATVRRGARLYRILRRTSRRHRDRFRCIGYAEF